MRRREVYADTVRSHNVAAQWYRHSETKREREMKRRTYKRKIKNTFSIVILHAERAERACSHTCKLPIIHSDTDTERQKERETNED